MYSLFLLAVLILPFASSSPAFLMMYSAYRLNKQGDNIQPWRTPFPIWNQSVLCPVLTVASWPAYRFLRSGGLVFPSLEELPTVCCDPHKGFGVVNKAQVVIFLELACSFDVPMDVGNLSSGSFAFSKPSLNICKFTVHVLLKPGLENFEHCFASVWDYVQLCSNLSILWHCISLGLEWKLTFSRPLATAESSKFIGILSAALLQHHLLGIPAQLEFHHLC